PRTNTMGVFDGIEKASAGFTAEKQLRDGIYRVRIDQVKTTTSHKGRVFMATEMTVLAVLQEVPGIQPHKVGQQIVDLVGSNEYFLGNVKRNVANILGISPDDVKTADCERLVSEE